MEIIVNVADDEVTIDGFKIYGHVEGSKRCETCECSYIYYGEFDSYFCPQCNTWHEPACKDPNCDYCSKRPEKPLPHK
ncbi:MAG: hypothetical protein UHX00_14375 [Caryophanon sp.]|uniref:Viral late gene transcription factor 3 zinc ribbon domain-containing protein n=1 Tax=Caryophanon latum TaxID=33977 RepID=A0A1C0YX65_9BACL|nr:hypothetical protein [Caryophanon latum]MEE1132804.1 hypothetical protein [Caryophanon sp.]OCS91751.1 hypothetical protein A6K76_01150 [Caryophanon latum]